jgi:hypothetical protein
MQQQSEKKKKKWKENKNNKRFKTEGTKVFSKQQSSQ